MMTLLPPYCAVAQEYGAGSAAPLLPAEQAVAQRFSAKRRAEFASVRRCARQALALLGVPPAPILPDASRAPIWPEGIVGSMTHCDNYRAAAVARRADCLSLGIDAEPNAPLPPGVRELLAEPAELRYLEQLETGDTIVAWDRLCFSAKEAVYKALFPVTGQWLEFRDVAIQFDTSDGSFTASLQSPPAEGTRCQPWSWSCRWALSQGVLMTAVALTEHPEFPHQQDQ